jgi:hypothetical protein
VAEEIQLFFKNNLNEKVLATVRLYKDLYKGYTPEINVVLYGIPNHGHGQEVVLSI